MTFVADLAPRELWKHFDRILTIPRGSGNEVEIREYIVGIAERNSLEHEQDSVGNLVVRKPASPGRVQGGGTVLQCHLDMVNEKNSDVQHNFCQDPIRPLQDGDYLTADGTTLGSDNGIGIAAALAVLEDGSLEHGQLECLFTVDEETGLTGASGLSPEMLRGTYLINLDSEEEGALYVGCAGGAGVDLILPLAKDDAAGNDEELISVNIGGLSGGHSGIDIHLQRGNAISILARCLNALLPAYEFRLTHISGGNMHNAIPREASARLAVSRARVEQFREDLRKNFEKIAAEYSKTDSDLGMEVSSSSEIEMVFDLRTTSTVLGLLFSLPHGVASMSNDIPGLVETSSNVATAAIQDDELLIHVSNRSSVESALDGIQQRVIAIGELAGASAEWVEGYPGWQPDMESPLLALVERVHQQTLGFAPEPKAVHAGLECGIIKEKYPKMDVISFGPQIEFPHSPDERVKIDSAASFFRLLAAVLGNLART